MIIKIRQFLHFVFCRRILFSLILTGLFGLIVGLNSIGNEGVCEQSNPSLGYVVLCNLGAINLLASCYFILEKQLKNMPLKFRRPVKVFVMLFALTLSLMLGLILICHPASIIRILVDENRGLSCRKDLAVCSVIVPRGWYTEVKSDFNGIDVQKLLYLDMPNETIGGCDDAESPHLIFLFGYGRDEQAFLNTLLGKGITSLDSVQRIVHDVMDKELILYRYEGTQRMGGDSKIPLKIESFDCEAVTIAFCSNFGFYGFFLGTPQHEQVFWDTVNSIEWKEIE